MVLQRTYLTRGCRVQVQGEVAIETFSRLMYASIDTLNQIPVKPISKLLHSSDGLDHQGGTGETIAHCGMI